MDRRNEMPRSVFSVNSRKFISKEKTHHRSFIACQFQWGQKWQVEAGATTGEEAEQINSHFSQLGNSTKHMLPEGEFSPLLELCYYNYVTQCTQDIYL